MKKFSPLFILLILTCCGKTNNKQLLDDTNPFYSIVTNVNLLKNNDLLGASPIEAFTKFANDHASKIIQLDTTNIQLCLETVKQYNHAFIVVANHTIVKINDLRDCKPSASWGSCMPMAEGYIKKGELQHKKDYCNLIIGLPDEQKRVLYLFD